MGFTLNVAYVIMEEELHSGSSLKKNSETVHLNWLGWTEYRFW